jgi:hypothetical protein
MNAALGGVSAGGFGNPLFDVTQRGGGPNELVANQSDSNAGGVTLSKFSSNTIAREQGAAWRRWKWCRADHAREINSATAVFFKRN